MLPYTRDDDPWEKYPSDDDTAAPPEPELDQEPEPEPEPERGAVSAEEVKLQLRQYSGVIFGGMSLLLAFMGGLSPFLTALRRYFPAFDRLIVSMSDFSFSLMDAVLSVLTLALPCLLIVVLLELPLKAAFPLAVPSPRIAVPAVFCCLGVAAVGVIVSTLLRVFLAEATGYVPVMPDRPPPYTAAETVLYFIKLAVIPAFCEELFFRGAVLQPLRRFGDGFALAVSSLLFACAHGNLVQAPNAFITGLLLGYFALRTGTVFTSMLMHFANNAIAALLNIAMLYVPQEAFGLVNSWVIPAYLGLGILGLILMLALNDSFTRLVPADTGIGAGEKCLRFFSSPFALFYLVLAVYVMSRNFMRI